MNTTIAVTRQWQITLPKWVRDLVDWKNPGQAKLGVEGGKITIEPKESEVLSLIGKYKHLKPTHEIDLDNVRDYIDYSNL